MQSARGFTLLETLFVLALAVLVIWAASTWALDAKEAARGRQYAIDIKMLVDNIRAQYNNDGAGVVGLTNLSAITAGLVPQSMISDNGTVQSIVNPWQRQISLSTVSRQASVVLPIPPSGVGCNEVLRVALAVEPTGFFTTNEAGTTIETTHFYNTRPTEAAMTQIFSTACAGNESARASVKSFRIIFN